MYILYMWHAIKRPHFLSIYILKYYQFLTACSLPSVITIFDASANIAQVKASLPYIRRNV